MTVARSVDEVLSDEKRSNAKRFQEETQDNSLKTAMKRKECQVENKLHRNCRGSCVALRGAPGFS